MANELLASTYHAENRQHEKTGDTLRTVAMPVTAIIT